MKKTLEQRIESIETALLKLAEWMSKQQEITESNTKLFDSQNERIINIEDFLNINDVVGWEAIGKRTKTLLVETKALQKKLDELKGLRIEAVQNLKDFKKKVKEFNERMGK